MLKALFRFIVGVFAMIGFINVATYVWFRIESRNAGMLWNIPDDFRVIFPALIVSILVVAYMGRTKSSTQGRNTIDRPRTPPKPGSE